MATAPEQTASGAEVARSYFEAIGRHDLEAMLGNWDIAGYGEIHGLVVLRASQEAPTNPTGSAERPAELLRDWFGNLFRAFPNFKMEIVEIVADGDKAAVRWRATGTFNGDADFEGMAPTGESVEIEGLDLVTTSDGLIRDNQAYMNGTQMARQLGAMPPAGSLGEKVMLGAVNARTAVTDWFSEQRRRRAG